LHQREHAKTLRKNQTEAEQRLWYFLRAHRFMGLKFRRQVPIGNYIVDFVCHDHKLIVEADGGQHAEELAYDRKRDEWLLEQGFKVIRFWNDQILRETDAVLEQIRLSVAASLSPAPLPLAGEGKRNGNTVEN
jgi:very-short-patch-repair endonuclease